MRNIARSAEKMLLASRFSFSGFGTYQSIQLDPITPTYTKTILYLAATPPINKSTILSKIKILTSLLQSAICDMSTLYVNLGLFPVTMALTPWKISRNWATSLLWVKTFIILKWMLTKL